MNEEYDFVSSALADADSLFREVRRPEKQRSPSNGALWFVFAFVMVVGATLDLISASTVFRITGGMWLYSILTFLSGFIPLAMWEAAFMRPYSSPIQRKISIFGSLMSVTSITVIGILAALANAQGLAANAWAETATLIGLVLVAIMHGSLAFAYFHIDDGIRAEQVTAQNIAYYRRRRQNAQLAEKMLEDAAIVQRARAQLVERFKSPHAVNYVLSALDGYNDESEQPRRDASPVRQMPGRPTQNPTMPPERGE